MLCLSLQSQVYYWQMDGTSNDEELQRAEVSLVGNPTPNTNGHIYSGFNDATGYPLYAVAVDETGTSFVFQNTYLAYNTSSLGTAYTSQKCLIVESPVASTCEYALAGDFHQAANQSAIYFVALDAAGVPITAGATNGTYYYLNPYWTTSTRDIIYVGGKTAFYILSRHTLQSFGITHYYLSMLVVDVYGSVIWDGIYGLPDTKNPNEPQKMVYNPVTDQIMVVGYYHDLNTPNNEAYVFVVDDNSTHPGTYHYYGNSGSDDELNGIVICNSGSQAGEVMVCGTTDYAGTNDVWAMHLPLGFGTSIFSSTYDYQSSSADDHGQDLFERQNNMSGYEYCLGGYTNNGTAGGKDMTVFRIDNSGTLQYDFSYGGSDDEIGLRIDHDPNASSKGFNIYGTSDDAGGLGGVDMSMFKCYYSGHTKCNYDDDNNVSAVTGPDYFGSNDINHEEGYYVYDFYMDVPSTISSTQICTGSDPSGSNARMGPEAISIQAVPAGDQLSLTISSAEQQALEVSLTDMAGRVLYTGTVNTSRGTSTYELDLAGHNITSGIYLLTARNRNVSTAYRIVIP